MGLNLCDRCVADCRHHREPNEIVVKCGAFKAPETNADRIRAMSDEELASWLEYEGGGACAEVCGWMDWLRKPAEED